MGRKRKADTILLHPVAGADEQASVATSRIANKRKRRPLSRDAITDEYHRLLRSSSQIIGTTVIRVSPTCLAVRDISVDMDTGNVIGLQNRSFVHVYEVPVAFKHSKAPETLRVCSCQDMAAVRAILPTLDTTTETRHTILKAGQPLAAKCLHVQALERWLRQPHTPQQPTPSEKVVKVDHRDDMLTLSVEFEQGPWCRAFVTTDKHKHYHCASCSYDIHGCVHVRELAEWLELTHALTQEPFAGYTHTLNPKARPRPPPKNARERRVAISTHPISLDTISKHVARRTEGTGSWLPHGSSDCVPTCHGACPNCASAWDTRDPVTEGWLMKRGTLYGSSSSMRVDVYYRKCSHCNFKKQYDGWDDGVYNFSNECLFLHEVMLGYVDAMPECQMPINAYFCILQRAYKRATHAFCSKTTFTQALEAFFPLLDIQYGDSFECPKCAQLHPSHRIVLGDGKVMGFRSDLVRDIEPPGEVRFPGREINTASMCYLTKKNGFCHKVRAYAAGKNDPKTASLHILRKLARTHNREDLLWMLGSEICPEEYKTFLGAISTEYTVNSLIHQPTEVILRTILDRPGRIISVEDKHFFHQYFPAFFDLIQKAKWSAVPPEAVPMLRSLVDLAAVPYEPDPMETDIPENPNAFFPNNPYCRRALRPTNLDDPDLHNVCTKHTKKTRHVTPGVFALFCPHGICLGFEAMMNFESTMTPFNILYRRFPIPPGYMHYDNGCNLSRTCMKLASRHFATTVFMIDRMHWPDHRACHLGFCMNAYPKNMPMAGGSTTIGAVNSQVCEQCNAKLEMIAKQTKFMNQETYMMYTKLFLYLCNKDLLDAMKTQ